VSETEETIMKTVLLASALMISGVAFAQADPRDAGQPIGSGNTLQPGTTMGERDTHGTNMPAAPTANTGTSMSTDMSTGSSTMGTGTTMGTTGTTMGTTGSTMGTTGSGTMVVQQGGNMTPPPEPRASYPRCSRTITDNCVQDERRARDTRRSRR
jgi:hypothetical protein